MRVRLPGLKLRLILIACVLMAAVIAWCAYTYVAPARIMFIEGGMSIPYISQLDYKKQVCTVSGKAKSVRSSGCGAACASMVIRYLTGDTDQTPQTLFDWAYENGHYFGQGLSHECLTEMLSMYGIEGRWIENDKIQVYQALYEEKPVIAHMGPGTFTNEGHYIVLRGVDENGNIYVNDPSSLTRSQTVYSLDLIFEETRNGAAFMICG